MPKKPHAKEFTKRAVVGIDFDDVIFNFNDALHDFHNAKYGTTVKRSDVVVFDIFKIWDCTPEEAAKKVFEFCFAPDHDSAPAVVGSIETIAKLKKECDLHIITSRGERVRTKTIDWINRHLPGHFSSVNLTNQYYGDPDKVKSKADVCRELGIGVMIEDSMSNAKLLGEKGIRVILLDCPWNQGELPVNVTRVKSWYEIPALIK